jgi:hypothetical protein
MAKSDISLKINSIFNAEGLKKMNQGVKKAAGEAKNASKALGGIQSALGGIGGEAGKVAGQVGGVVQAFTSLGIAGGVIAAGTLAIEKLFDWLNKTNTACANLAKTFGDRLKAGVSKVRGEVEKLNKAFSDFLANQKRGNEKRNIVMTADIAGMEEQKKQALAGKDGSEAAKTELEWIKKIEDAKEEAARKQHADVQRQIADTRKQIEA